MLNLNTQFYTVSQAADRLEISKETLRAYLRKGQIKGYKKFSRWFVFESDLVEFLKSE